MTTCRPLGRTRRPGAVAVLAVAALLAACADTPPPESRESVEEFTHVHGLEVPAWAPEAVYVATHQGLLRIEADEWWHVSEERHDFMGFSAHPAEPGVLYTSGHPAPDSDVRNPVGLMVSTDGGVTWQVRALEGTADFHAMTVGAGGVVYGWNVFGETGLYRSDDEGRSWERLDAQVLHESEGALALAVHPTDPQAVWAATAAGLYRSADGGLSWEPVLDAVPVTAVAFDPTEPDRLLAYAAPPGAGLLESVDGGTTWTPLGLVLDGDAVGHVAVDPQDPQTLYAGTYGEALLRSTDGGTAWETLAEDGVPVDR